MVKIKHVAAVVLCMSLTMAWAEAAKTLALRLAPLAAADATTALKLA